ncbi:hypothetical protein SKAU_G00121890 [Synaphobranchus kaupii]|uniref:Uncharacterized protein n=1 Tax=Synaphobranchus kaupii TaxID=118154 RepID=A0A9Q1FNW0_SYNKA|nr:hypothetical protein SKAU_G00121890 [Synaphobranchus kaupii]
MNSIELNREQREGVLEEAVRAFECNIEVFDDVQKILSVTAEVDMQYKQATHSRYISHGDTALAKTLPASLLSASPLLRLLLGVCVAVATVGVGMYTF